MDGERIQETLEEAGEVMVTVEEIEKPLELHLHDTEIGDEVITVDLADGTLTVGLDSISGYWTHKHSLDDYGLH